MTGESRSNGSRAWAVLLGRTRRAGAAIDVAAGVAAVRLATQAALVRGGAVELVLTFAPGEAPGSESQLGEVEAIARSGPVSRVLVLEHALFARRSPGARACAIAAAVERAGGVHTICLAHDYDAIDSCGLLASRLDALPMTGVVAMRSDDGDGVRLVRPVHGGRWHAELVVRRAPLLVLTAPRDVASGSAPAVVAGALQAAPPLERIELDASLAVSLPDREVLGIEEPPAAPSLAAAERIVAVGRGLGGPEHLPMAERLARALGAELAGSRPVIDAGWLPSERQVGSSGQSVAPALYVALGISGAAQHLEGMSGSRCVVAVNRDAEAPIMRVARYAIVGDVHEVVPAIADELERERSGQGQ